MRKLILIQTGLIIVLAVALLLSRGCNNSKLAEKQSLIDNLEAQAQVLDSIVNKQGKTITLQQVEIVDGQRELRRMTDSIFNLKKKQEKQIKNVIAYYKGITKTEIKEVKVPFIDSAERAQWSDSVAKACSKVIEYYEANTVTVPKDAKVQTVNYFADLTVVKSGVNINSLIVPDSQYVRFVTIKGGFLKKDQQGKRHLFTKKSVQVQVLHTNPLIHVTGENSVLYQPKAKKNIVGKAVLIGLGIFIGSKL